MGGDGRDLLRLERTATLSQGKRELLEQVFRNYSVIEVSISDLALLGGQGSAPLGELRGKGHVERGSSVLQDDRADFTKLDLEAIFAKPRRYSIIPTCW